MVGAPYRPPSHAVAPPSPIFIQWSAAPTVWTLKRKIHAKTIIRTLKRKDRAKNIFSKKAVFIQKG